MKKKRKQILHINDYATTVAAACILLIALTIFFTQSATFSKELIDAANHIYQGVVSTTDGGSFSFEPAIDQILKATMYWFVQLFITATLGMYLITTLLSSKQKIKKHQLTLSIGLTAIIAALLLLFKAVSLTIDTIVVIGLIIAVYPLIISIFQRKAFTLSQAVGVMKKTLLWTILFFIAITGHFLLSLLMLRTLSTDPYQTVFGPLLRALYIILQVIILHGYLHSIAQQTTTTFKSIKVAFTNKKAYLITTGAVIAFGILQILAVIVGSFSMHITLRILTLILFIAISTLTIQAILNHHKQ
jgi:hypothetical protein